MMPINFPDSPEANDIYTVDTSSWKFDGEKWLILSASASIDTLNSLTDVSISSPISGEVLAYNGSTWVNESVPSGGYLDGGNALTVYENEPIDGGAA